MESDIAGNEGSENLVKILKKESGNLLYPVVKQSIIIIYLLKTKLWEIQCLLRYKTRRGVRNSKSVKLYDFFKQHWINQRRVKSLGAWILSSRNGCYKTAPMIH